MGQVQFPLLDGGFSSNKVTYTITSHMIGMFLPGLFSGHVVNYIGTWATTFIGFTIFVAAGILFMLYNSLAMIILGMTTIGLGWNFSFVGPSSDVSKIYNDAEKSKVVGFNDGIMLGTIGIFNLAGEKRSSSLQISTQ